MTRSAGTLCSLLLLLAAGRAAAGPLELVSRVHPSQTSDTAAGALDYPPYFSDDDSCPRLPSLSADGRYAVFVSVASNLAPGQREANLSGVYGEGDVFLRDLATGATKLVSRSLASASTTGNAESGVFGAVLSADGRWVAFVSEATDLVPGQQVSPYGDDNGYVMLFDTVSETMTLVASIRDNAGELGCLAISADGRYLTFTSRSTDVLPGTPFDINDHVYLYDRAAAKLRLVDHKRGFPNAPADGFSVSLGISADGRYTLYTSSADGLVTGQRPGDRVFLYDRTTDTTLAAGAAGYAPADAALSADGKYVLTRGDQGVAALWSRESRATTLLTGAPNAAHVHALSADGRYALLDRRDSDNSFTLVIYDRVSRAYTAVPRPAGLNRIALPALSADGRYALFLDAEKNAVPGQVDHNDFWDLFLFDRATGKTALVSRSVASASATTTANAPSYAPALSANGSRAVFSSAATDLVTDVTDLNDGLDLFSYAVGTATVSLASPHAPDLPSLSPESYSAASDLSADGRWVAFESHAAHLVAGQVDTNGKSDVFLYDRATKQTILVSHATAAGSRTGNGSSIRPALSADGRYVSFLSQATDLVAGPAAPADFYSLYVFDRVDGTARFVARTGLPQSSLDESTPAGQRISADGNWVVFTSVGDDLVPGQHQNIYSFNVFLWSRETGALTLLTRSSLYADLWTAYGSSRDPEISADGRWIAFRSTATDLVPGQTSHPDNPSDNPENVFLYDRSAGALTLASHEPGSPAAGASVLTPPSLSADGRFVTFGSVRGDLDGQADHGYSGLYLYDRTLGTSRWIAQGFFNPPRISADGRFVAFLGHGPLVPGIPDDRSEYFLYDVAAGTFTLASPSRIPGRVGSAGNDFSADCALSADGRYLAFGSKNKDLVPGQPEGPAETGQGLFLFDRVSGQTVAVALSRSAVESAWGPRISADGRRTAFTSDLGLDPADRNQRQDAYLFDLDKLAPGGPVALPPCALFDGPAQRSNVRKVLAVAGSCGVPTDATRVTVKVTALQGTAAGNLRLYPGDVASPPAGTLRFVKNRSASATFDLPLSTDGAGTIALLPFVRGNGTVHVMIEVDGYTR